jgi:hypothetical protein
LIKGFLQDVRGNLNHTPKPKLVIFDLGAHRVQFVVQLDVVCGPGAVTLGNFELLLLDRLGIHGVTPASLGFACRA